MTTQIGKIVRRVGKTPKRITYSDLRLERRGFLSVYSFQTSDVPHRLDMMYRDNAVVVLPVDFGKRVIYMIEQPRHLEHFAEKRPGKHGPCIAPGMRADLLQGVSLGSPVADDERDPQNEMHKPQSLSVEVDANSVLSLELPAGVIDPGDATAEDAALRELQEEAGFRADRSRLTEIAAYFPSIGGTTERLTAYIAQVDGLRHFRPKGDGSETIVVRQVPFDEVWSLLRTRNERIETGSTHILLRELRIMELEGTMPTTPPKRVRTRRRA